MKVIGGSSESVLNFEQRHGSAGLEVVLVVVQRWWWWSSKLLERETKVDGERERERKRESVSKII